MAKEYKFVFLKYKGIQICIPEIQCCGKGIQICIPEIQCCDKGIQI